MALDKPGLGAGLGPGWACWMTWGRPVSVKLGPEAGLTGLASRRVAGWAGPEPSLRHVRPNHTKKAFFSDFRTCQHIFDKNGLMELDADEPRKFQGLPDRILGPADLGGGGGKGGWGRGTNSTEKFLLGQMLRWKNIHHDLNNLKCGFGTLQLFVLAFRQIQRGLVPV